MCSQTKPYFQVARPYHFRVRPDLIEELCVAENFDRTLPRTQSQYAKWLSVCGVSPTDAPFETLQARPDSHYAMTPRYVFQSVVQPGCVDYTNIVTDANGWVATLEYHGLFDFLINRAVEFAGSKGMTEIAARNHLRQRKVNEAIDLRRSPPWGIGYEPGSGLCVILATDHPDTQKLFLAGQWGYHTPFHSAD